MSWLPLVLELVTTGLGAYQYFSSDKPKDPKYNIPAEVYASLGEMEDRASSGLPGRELMMENLLSEGAGLLTQLKDTAVSGASLQGSVNSLAGGMMKQMTGIEIMNSQFKDSARVDYANALLQMAEYKDKQWDMNVYRPYTMKMNEYINNRNAGMTNMFNGISGMADYIFQEDMMRKYGGENSKNPGGGGKYKVGDMDFQDPVFYPTFNRRTGTWWQNNTQQPNGSNYSGMSSSWMQKTSPSKTLPTYQF